MVQGIKSIKDFKTFNVFIGGRLLEHGKDYLFAPTGQIHKPPIELRAPLKIGGTIEIVSEIPGHGKETSTYVRIFVKGKVQWMLKKKKVIKWPPKSAPSKPTGRTVRAARLPPKPKPVELKFNSEDAKAREAARKEEEKRILVRATWNF